MDSDNKTESIAKSLSESLAKALNLPVFFIDTNEQSLRILDIIRNQLPEKIKQQFKDISDSQLQEQASEFLMNYHVFTKVKSEDKFLQDLSQFLDNLTERKSYKAFLFVPKIIEFPLGETFGSIRTITKDDVAFEGSERLWEHFTYLKTQYNDLDEIIGRLGESGNQLNNQYELAAYLYDHLQEGIQRSSIIMGRADVLFRFLQDTGLNRSEDLAKFITDLDPHDEQRTISNQIIDRIIDASPDKEEMYKKHERAKRAVDAHLANQASMTFISLWIDLETITRTIIHDLKSLPPNLKQGNLLQPSASVFRAIGMFRQNEEALEVVERLRRLRNQIVHGIESPDSDYLNENIKLLESLFINLKDQSSEEVAEVVEDSEKIQEIIGRIKENVNQIR